MSRIRGSWTTRTLVLVLAATLQTVALPPLAAEGDAAVEGLVVATGTNMPVPGATVHMIDPRSGQIHSSTPTDEEGRYAISGLAGAGYQLGVEIDGKLYVAASPAVLESGQTREVHVAINPQAAEQIGELPSGKAGVWSNPLTAALIVVGGAILIAVAIDAGSSSSSTVSASVP